MSRRFLSSSESLLLGVQPGQHEAGTLPRVVDTFHALFERAGIGLYSSTPDGRFLAANAALVAMLGYERFEQLQELDIARDIYRNPADRQRLIQVARRSEPQGWVEVDWKRRDGSPLLVRLTGRVVLDEYGETIRCEAIVEDVTELRRRESLVRRGERMAALGTTLAGAAHELNNPLAAISGYAQLMRNGTEGMDVPHAIDTIDREARRAARIARDLLAFARREETRERSELDVNEIVQYILGSRRYAIETRGVTWRLSLGRSLPAILGDHAQIEQVVLNLVLNAEQAIAAACDGGERERATGRRGELEVRTFADGDTVTLDVIDNGDGIPADDLCNIWESFWTTRSEIDGSGLGLPMVHTIVTSHGGTVEVQSHEHVGSRFRVTFPTAARVRTASALSALAPDPGVPDESPDGRPLDILIVDDEPAIRRFLKHYLVRRGHAVLTASGGEEALELARQTPLDVVICDLLMPGGISGNEVFRRMREIPGMERVRFLVTTAEHGTPEAGVRLASLQEQGGIVLAKPYDIERLRRLIETV